MTIDNTFLQEQITATKAQIVAYQAAVTSLSSGAVESYTLDTGQTTQTVKKINVATLQRTITSLYNQLAVLCARKSGGTVLVVPHW